MNVVFLTTAAGAEATSSSPGDGEDLVVFPMVVLFNAFAFGSVPSGAMFSRTPDRKRPASWKLGLFCTGGSSQLRMKFRCSLMTELLVCPPAEGLENRDRVVLDEFCCVDAMVARLANLVVAVLWCVGGLFWRKVGSSRRAALPTKDAAELVSPTRLLYKS